MPMNTITIWDAQIIDQALRSEDATVKLRAYKCTPSLMELLTKNGLVLSGDAPGSKRGEDKSDPLFFSVLKVVNREIAEQAVSQFSVAKNPINFKLKPFKQETFMANYLCPTCASDNLSWPDGDCVSVPVLPEGICDHEQLDTLKMHGQCLDCQEELYFYEFGFTTVPNPDDLDIFSVTDLSQLPDRYQMFTAKAKGMTPWVMSRRWYWTGKVGAYFNPGVVRLPKGAFAVDYHQFGPFLAGRTGPYGKLRHETSNWSEEGTRLFTNLAKSAMISLMAGASEAMGRNE